MTANSAAAGSRGRAIAERLNRSAATPGNSTETDPAAVEEVTTADAEIVLTEDQARDLTNQIMMSAEGLWQLIVRAYTERAWEALGYNTWDIYCEAEFGECRLKLPREERAETVLSLRKAGLSIRAIASATGAAVNTVRSDLENQVCQIDTPEAKAVTTGTDGKTYARRKPTPKPTPKPQQEATLDPQQEATPAPPYVGDADPVGLDFDSAPSDWSDWELCDCGEGPEHRWVHCNIPAKEQDEYLSQATFALQELIDALPHCSTDVQTRTGELLHIALYTAKGGYWASGRELNELP